MNKKEFIIDGNDFLDLEGFMNSIGEHLVENNDWGKNWNALNDILWGGFVKTDYEEPFKLLWLNSNISKVNLDVFADLVELIKEHKHIELELK
mgnify:CR=1 FL=1